MPPAISTSSETHPIAEISGASHSSKNTLGRCGKHSARFRASAKRSVGLLVHSRRAHCQIQPAIAERVGLVGERFKFNAVCGLAERLTGERLIVSVDLKDGGRLQLFGDGVSWSKVPLAVPSTLGGTALAQDAMHHAAS